MKGWAKRDSHTALWRIPHTQWTKVNLQWLYASSFRFLGKLGHPRTREAILDQA